MITMVTATATTFSLLEPRLHKVQFFILITVSPLFILRMYIHIYIYIYIYIGGGFPLTIIFLDSYIYYNDTEDDAAKAVPLIGAPPAALYHSFYPGAPPLPPMYFPPQGGNFSFRPPPFAPPPSPHHSIPPYPHHPYFNKLPHQLHSNRHSYPSPQPRSNTRSPRQRQHPPVVEDDRRSSPSPTSSSGSAPTSQFRNKVTLSATSSLSSPVGNRQRKSSSSSPGPKPHSSDVKTFYDWLKSLRLHKYYKKFGDVSFEEVWNVTKLIKLGGNNW